MKIINYNEIKDKIKKYSNDVDTNIMEKEKLITQLLEKGYSAEFIRDIIELTPKPTNWKVPCEIYSRSNSSLRNTARDY